MGLNFGGEGWGVGVHGIQLQQQILICNKSVREVLCLVGGVQNIFRGAEGLPAGSDPGSAVAKRKNENTFGPSAFSCLSFRFSIPDAYQTNLHLGAGGVNKGNCYAAR